MDGSSQLVIVALPTEDDLVRKVSSEKEPHLTLLYLGENKFTPAEITHISEYVEFAASLLPQFGLEVESRGELGENQADVLFFNKQWSKEIETFRGHLLRDDLIAGAYQSVEQFPGWVPHLTLGFPGTPAKKDDRDYPGFSYVSFDRIALWTADSSGPTFPLKLHDYGLEVAMSQPDLGRDAVTEILSHSGVKGMKWGVRKAESGGSAASASKSSEDAVKAAAATSKAKAAGSTSVLSNHELQNAITRMNLESQYRTLTAQKSSLDKGVGTTQKILKAGKTIEDVRRFMATPTGQAVKTGLKGAFAAANVGAAFATGGTSAAASTGTAIVVRSAVNHYTNVGR